MAVSKAACVYFVAAQADISELRFGWRRAVMKLILIAAACAASPRQLLEVAIETADSHARRLLDSAIEYVTWVANKRFEISKFKFKIPRARTSELQGSFSAVSKPNFASKYSLESSRRDLHNALLCTVLESNPKKPFSNLNFFGKNRQNFFAIELMNIH